MTSAVANLPEAPPIFKITYGPENENSLLSVRQDIFPVFDATGAF